MIRGVDISRIQNDGSPRGQIDWVSLWAEGIRFAYIKCAQGNEGLPDHDFQANVAGARAVGMLVGVYHFAYPLPVLPGTSGLRDPEAQAQLHFGLSGGLGSRVGELPPALDLEWPPPTDWDQWGCSAAQIRAWGLAYLAKATELHGRKPVVYTYPDFAAHVVFGLEARYADYELWLASYPSRPSWPADASSPPASVPKPWTRWRFWQWTGGGAKIPGGPPVDYDVFAGTLDDLRGLAGLPPDVQVVASNAIQTAATEIDESAHDAPEEPT